MKDVIDVLQLQRDKTQRKTNPINYIDQEDNFFGIRFIFECGKCLVTAGVPIYLQIIFLFFMIRGKTANGSLIRGNSCYALS